MSVGSFLEPCIIPYRNRPIGFALGASKKNLLHVFGSVDDVANDQETIKVYLRLKPPHSHHDRVDLMDILDNHTLLVKASSGDDLLKRKTPDCKYTFSKIFGTKTRQKELFMECVYPLVKDFLNGQNCLLFSFGTTNAGKTFTIQGTGDQPGIIPRVLTMTFKSVFGKVGTNNTLCPYQVMSAIELTRNSLIELDDLKNRIIYWTQNDSGHGHVASNLRGSVEDLNGSQKFCEMQHILDSEVKGIKCDIDDSFEVSVWVSFIEIYNERIFDLLEDSCERGKKRRELKLSQDPHKNNYVKGVRYIPVKSEAEAYKVLLYGKHNLQTESTNLNSSSSRSHCIFTIKLLKYSKLGLPDFVNVSSFSICDLAGSERQKKTLNSADRLKESQSINSSLHVLNRCFNIIRENQIRSEKQLVPYRDSKLTQLFKRALSGHESVTMIVNVSLSKFLYEESQYALKASAIAHQIIVQAKPRLKQSVQRSSRFSQLISKHNGGGTILWDSSVKSDTSGERDGSCDSKLTFETSQIQKLQEEVESLLDMIQSLHDRLRIKKGQLREEKQKNRMLEHNLRKQLTSEFEKILMDTESHYKKQFEFMEENKEKTFESTVEIIRNCERHMEIANKRKRCDSEGSYMTVTENTATTDKMQALQDEIDQLKEVMKVCDEDTQEELRIAQKKITGLTELLEASKRERAEMSSQINELKFQNGLLHYENKKLQRTAEAAKSENTKALLDQIEHLKEVIKDRDSLLEEARLDIEHEIKEREQAENEIASLETQLAEKDDIIDKLNTDLSSVNHLLTMQLERNEFLEDNLEKYNEKDEVNKNLQNEVEDLTNLLAERTEQLKSAEAKIKQQEDEVNEKLQNEIEDLTNLLAERTEQLKCAEVKIKQQEDEVNKKLQNEIEDLTNLLAERTEQLKSAEEKIKKQEELHLQLSNAINDCNAKEQQISDLEREVKTLLSELKQKIQKNQELENSSANEEVLKKLKEEIAAKDEDLKNVKSLVRELQESITFKDLNLECLRNKLEAFEQTASILTAYKDEVEKKNTELKEAKELSARQADTIANLEQEMVTFQNNQKTINSKYDEQLRKCKEDVEREKREAARLRETWIKLTPTPKSKEEYIKRLEQQLDLLTKSEEYRKKNRSPCNTCNRENKSARKKKVAKSLLPQGVCTRSMKVSIEDGIVPFSENTINKQSKSTQKKGRQQNPLNLISSNCDEKWSNYKSEQSLLESSKKTRRKLYTNTDQTSTNDEDTEQIEEIPCTFHQSPNSVIKCNLRQKFDSHLG